MPLKQRLSLKGKARMISEMLDHRAAHDSFCVCSFIDSITTEKIQRAMNLLYKSKPDVVKAGKAIVDLERKLDVLRGLKKEHDVLPHRILEEETYVKGKKVKIKTKEFEKLKQEFCRIRKW
jgi:aldehyde:ferredoxin oxidoreductase